MKELNTIQTKLNAPKNQRNNFGGYNYRSCEDILEALKPLLKETGCTLTLTDSIEQVGDRFYIKATATITNDKGETATASAYAREPLTKKGMDEAQITGATSSYARKIALGGLFAIDDNKDADATNTHGKEAPQAPAPAEADELQTALKSVAACRNATELKAVWNSHKALQKTKEFKEAVAKSPVNPNRK